MLPLTRYTVPMPEESDRVSLNDVLRRGVTLLGKPLGAVSPEEAQGLFADAEAHWELGRIEGSEDRLEHLLSEVHRVILLQQTFHENFADIAA